MDYTGQHKDDTGLVYDHARYYDPVLARFISADSIVPGNASGKGGAVETLGLEGTPSLTVDFHEGGSARYEVAQQSSSQSAIPQSL